MKQKIDALISQNSVFIWIAVTSCAVLLIPFVAMRFTTEVNWDSKDFVVMGSLLFGMASLSVLAARRVAPRYRLLVGGLFAVVFVYAWAELAVGIFTNLGA